MIEINIPGVGNFQLAHAVFDYNGTLAIDGTLLPDMREAIFALGAALHVHVITADASDLARSQLAGLPVKLIIVPAESQAEAKLEFISRLGADTVVAIGSSRNNRKMLRAAAIGIAVIQKEGASAETIVSADVVSSNIFDALDLLDNPVRLVATLRS